MVLKDNIKGLLARQIWELAYRFVMIKMEFKIIWPWLDRQDRNEPSDVNICGRKSVKYWPYYIERYENKDELICGSTD